MGLSQWNASQDSSGFIVISREVLSEYRAAIVILCPVDSAPYSAIDLRAGVFVLATLIAQIIYWMSACHDPGC